MRQHHPSCEPDREPCACKALARNDAAWADDARRHWPSYAAGIADRDRCPRCGGAAKVYRQQSADPADVGPEPCDCS